jgi:hypothetical protein
MIVGVVRDFVIRVVCRGVVSCRCVSWSYHWYQIRASVVVGSVFDMITDVRPPEVQGNVCVYDNLERVERRPLRNVQQKSPGFMQPMHGAPLRRYPNFLFSSTSYCCWYDL